MMQSHEDDSCCGAALSAALLAGALDNADEWDHEDCGAIWRATVVGEVKHWAPVSEFEVWP